MANTINSCLRRTDTSFITGWSTNIRLDDSSSMQLDNSKSDLRRTDSCFVSGWFTDINLTNKNTYQSINYVLDQKKVSRIKILE